MDIKKHAVSGWLALSIAVGLAAAPPSVEAQTPPPAADFFRPAQLTNARLSPDGRFLAATRTLEQTGRDALVVIALDGDPKATVAAAYNNMDVVDVHWAGNEMLVYRMRDRQASLFHQQGAGLYAVDREGKDRREIIRRNWNSEFGTHQVSSTEVRTRPRDRSLDPTHAFLRMLEDGSPRALVVKRYWDHNEDLIGTDLLLVDVASGRSEIISAGAPPNVRQWRTDAQGRVRAAVSAKGGRSTLHWKASAEAPWTVLRESGSYFDEGGVHPWQLGADGTLFVLAQGEGDTTVLAQLDTTKPGSTPRPLISVKGFDFEGEAHTDASGRLVGVDFLSDAWSTHWFDAGMKAVQAEVDKLLPNTVNLLDCGACNQPQRVLVAAFSDRQPTSYLVYDLKTQKLQPVGGARPWIRATQMAARSFERVKMRDGLEIPVHVTRPNGVKGAAPTVMLVHGGPFVRGGDWSWDAASQFLASRGYVVLEPEFRGSAGYGAKLLQAGFKQWGQAMQDDLVDTLAWVANQGMADAKRSCIVGGSYGGYAALMGLVREADPYRCAVSFVGVSDLNLMFTSDWSDLPGDWKRYGLTQVLGDPKADAARLAAHSPVRQAERIQRPLLIVHGRQDRRVPIEHASSLYAAVKKHNPAVEFHVYEEEGHGFAKVANLIDHWTRVETFLGRNLTAK